MFAFPTTTTSYTAAVYGLERGGVSPGWPRCPRLQPPELPDVPLAFLAGLGGPRIAQVRIARPDGGAGEAVAPLQEGRDRLQRLRHVPVAQVPGGDPGTEHRAVVHLSVAREPRVLLRREQVGLQRTGTAPLKLDELFHRLLLAGLHGAEARRLAVALAAVPGPRHLEAGVPIPGALSGRRVVALEILHHRVHRRVEAVEVHSVEHRWSPPRPFVVGAQPGEEIKHHGVAPHPGGEAAKPAQSRLRALIVRATLRPAVRPVGIRPVGLDEHPVESLLADEPLRDSRSRAV